MTRRLRRLQQFDVTLEIKDSAFLQPLREAQRNWLPNQAVNEFVGNLLHLDKVAARFVPGSERSALVDRTHSDLSDDDIMEDWQLPIMAAMAQVVTANHGDVLEIGFRSAAATNGRCCAGSAPPRRTSSDRCSCRPISKINGGPIPWLSSRR